MKDFVISSDSTCDLYSDYVKEHDIRIVPLTYTMEKGGRLTESKDAFTDYSQYVDFYRQLREGGFSRTSMLNYDHHFLHFQKLAEEGAENILHFSLSGGLSATAQAAKDAAADVMEEYPDCKIYAVDSYAATIGQGALVKEAVRLRAEGKSAQEAYDAVKNMPFHIQYVIIANDLYYLKKGGRVSAFAAAAGTVLKIKPVLSFTNEGKLTVVEKCKGMKKAFAYALEKMKRFPPVEENRMIWIVHTDAEQEAEELRGMVEQAWGFRPEVTIMGPVIGSHVGPGSVSMIWKSKEERQD
ncbi:MAG TPA: DegV family protein [Candidatus Borkfalkia stercoripullorum]|nr:DegV family protein [Candidatus Borkfalkia stercoripullorum]